METNTDKSENNGNLHEHQPRTGKVQHSPTPKPRQDLNLCLETIVEIDPYLTSRASSASTSTSHEIKEELKLYLSNWSKTKSSGTVNQHNSSSSKDAHSFMTRLLERMSDLVTAEVSLTTTVTPLVVRVIEMCDKLDIVQEQHATTYAAMVTKNTLSLSPSPSPFINSPPRITRVREQVEPLALTKRHSRLIVSMLATPRLKQ